VPCQPEDFTAAGELRVAGSELHVAGSTAVITKCMIGVEPVYKIKKFLSIPGKFSYTIVNI